MYKIKFWSRSLRGKKMFSSILAVLLTFTVCVPLLLFLSSGRLNNKVNTYVYNANQDGDDVTNSVNYALGIDSTDQYSDNVYYDSSLKNTFINVNNNENAIGITSFPVSLYFGKSFSYIYYFLTDYPFDYSFNYSLKSYFINNIFIRPLISNSPIRQNLNIFLKVDDEKGEVLKNNLYGNNPANQLWTEDYKIDSKWYVDSQEDAQLAVSYLFINWLLFDDNSYLVREQLNPVYYGKTNNEMGIDNYKYFSENVGLDEYNQTINFNVEGTGASRLVMYLLFNNYPYGFDIRVINFLDLDVEYNYIKVDSEDVYLNDDAFIAIKSGSLDQEKLESSFGYQDYSPHKNNYYSKAYLKTSNTPLYFTFYWQNLMFFINNNNSYLNPSGNYKMSYRISLDGLKMIYMNDFSIEDLVLHNQIWGNPINENNLNI